MDERSQLLDQVTVTTEITRVLTGLFGAGAARLEDFDRLGFEPVDLLDREVVAWRVEQVGELVELLGTLGTLGVSVRRLISDAWAWLRPDVYWDELVGTSVTEGGCVPGEGLVLVAPDVADFGVWVSDFLRLVHPQAPVVSRTAAVLGSGFSYADVAELRDIGEVFDVIPAVTGSVLERWRAAQAAVQVPK